MGRRALTFCDYALLVTRPYLHCHVNDIVTVKLTFDTIIINLIIACNICLVGAVLVTKPSIGLCNRNELQDALVSMLGHLSFTNPFLFM